MNSSSNFWVWIAFLVVWVWIISIFKSAGKKRIRKKMHSESLWYVNNKVHSLSQSSNTLLFSLKLVLVYLLLCCSLRLASWLPAISVMLVEVLWSKCIFAGKSTGDLKASLFIKRHGIYLQNKHIHSDYVMLLIKLLSPPTTELTLIIMW